ncbi:MAG TPA: hypothetical protein VFC46_15550, partial [Humisphaera sp.]|nr:hypothetical protein [Humisphaera sp.]
RARRWLGVFGPFARRERIAYSLFLLLVGLGSTTIYLGSRAFIYHEAIIWAVALALAFFDQLLAYLMDGRRIRLTAMCVLAFFCFFCRVTTGCGPLFSLLLICLNNIACHMAAPDVGSESRAGVLNPAQAVRSADPTGISTALLEVFRRLATWPKPPPLFHAAIAGICILTVTVTFVAINHAKFGTFFDASPMRYYAMMTAEPGREARSGGKWLRLGNIPTVLLAYTSIDAIVFQRSFPWINLQWELHKLPGSHMDGAGGYSSIVTAMPLFVVLAFAGGWVLSRNYRAIEGSSEPTSHKPPSLSIVLLGLCAGLMPVLAFCAVDNRYLHEFVPLLVVLSAFGIRGVLAIKRRGFRVTISCLLIVLGLFQLYANCSFSLSYQRDAVWGVPAKPRAEFRQWQRTIDRSLRNLFHHPG